MRITQGCFSFLPDLTDEQIYAALHPALTHAPLLMLIGEKECVYETDAANMSPLRSTR